MRCCLWLMIRLRANRKCPSYLRLGLAAAVFSLSLSLSGVVRVLRSRDLAVCLPAPLTVGSSS